LCYLNSPSEIKNCKDNVENLMPSNVIVSPCVDTKFSNSKHAEDKFSYGILATSGWKFPHVSLTEKDEKFLFDLEVYYLY
jgi:hypothetical protein